MKSREQLDKLNRQIGQCTLCPLRETATAPVCGLGLEGAKYFIIGEAPGANEDREGMPFIGDAGKKLDKLLQLGNIDINDVYLTNTCKCRPPKNKTPSKKLIRTCAPWLYQELELVQPEYIITLGSVPLSLFSDLGVSQLHGTTFDWERGGKTYKIVAQYHPAAALHQPRLWAVMLNDWEQLPQTVPHDFVVCPPRGLWKGKTIALDTENDPNGKLGLWSAAYRENGKICVEQFTGSQPQINFNDVHVIMQNAKWDIRVLRRNNMKTPENIDDTMIAAYCLGLGRQSPTDLAGEKSGSQMVGGLGLKYLARRHLGMKMKTWHEVKDRPELVPEYNCADSVATLLLWEKWENQLPPHYHRIDMPLLPVIMRMEDRGINIDQKFLLPLRAELEERINKIELPLNPNSNLEMQSYIYGTLGIEPWKFTDTGAPSVDSDVLESVDDPVVRGILEYKNLAKDLNTYASNYVERSQADGKIYAEFKQVSTWTGRLSSANPNLQNVPREGNMRKLFIASPGHKLVVMDYSQLELRVFAAITGEPEMLKTFARGDDIHDATARGMGVSRHLAKIFNFLTLYGGTAWKMSLEAGIPIDEAKAFQERYFEKYKVVGEYIKKMKAVAHKDQHVITFFGRKRRLDAMFSGDWRIRQQGEREAINTDTQATAADVVKLAMIDLDQKYKAPMILNVHDEIVFDIPAADALEYAHWLKSYVPTITEINGCFFPVDVGVGDNWADAKSDNNKI